MFKTNPSAYTIKDLNRETVIGNFYDTELCWVSLSYYLEPDQHIGNEPIVALDMSNYVIGKNLKYPLGVNISNLAAKSDFIALKGKVYQFGH